jgi:hypothetical protein
VFSVSATGGLAVAVWWVARGLKRGHVALPVAAGALVGVGLLTLVAATGLLKFADDFLDKPSHTLALIVLAGSVALLVAGGACWRAGGGRRIAPDRVALVLAIVGAVLACAALFVRYDGYSSLWNEVQDGEVGEYFSEPAVAVLLAIIGVVLLAARRRFAAGLLLAVGFAGALHFAGLLVAAWRAIGEIGDVRAAGFIGVLGGVLILLAGWRAAFRRPT